MLRLTANHRKAQADKPGDPAHKRTGAIWAQSHTTLQLSVTASALSSFNFRRELFHFLSDVIVERVKGQRLAVC